METQSLTVEGKGQVNSYSLVGALGRVCMLICSVRHLLVPS